jgi:hypothetical protein
MGTRKNAYIARFNRVLIWFTFALFVFFVVCGYGMVNSAMIIQLTGGILNRERSVYLHTTLALPVMVLLIIHTVIGLRSNLIRWGVKDGRLLDLFVFSLGAFFVALFVILQYTII